MTITTPPMIQDDAARQRPFPIDRTLLSLVLAAALIGGVGFIVRPTTRIGNEGYFWLSKATWKSCADVVLAGDSRVYHGMAPDEFSAGLHRRRVKNFGFSSCVYSAEYLEALEAVLDPGSRNQTIVLGVTPRSLTRKYLSHNGFTHRRAQLSPLELTKTRLFGNLLQRFEPLQVWEMKDIVNGIRGEATIRRKVFLNDGWVATTWSKMKPGRSLKIYRNEVFRENSVSRQIQAGLMQHVARWVDDGIAVYAVRPPTTPEMVSLENEISGFDEQAFVAEFESAGGIWLQAADSGYETYDGSHLTRTAAEDFSRDLAQRIRVFETRQVQQPRLRRAFQ